MGIALGIDLSWIVIDFWRQVGAKLASKIDKKSMQKNIQKMMANKRPLKASLKRLGAVLADLGGVVPRAGRPDGWFARPPKSRFFKTDQTPLELGKGKGNGLG